MWRSAAVQPVGEDVVRIFSDGQEVGEAPLPHRIADDEQSRIAGTSMRAIGQPISAVAGLQGSSLLKAVQQAKRPPPKNCKMQGRSL
jgi:hypothetical protein